MAVIGMRPYGKDTATLLRRAFDDWNRQCGNDPAYRDAAHQIENALREIELLGASPGRRAALSAMTPNNSGQSPSPSKTAPSRAEGSA